MSPVRKLIHFERSAPNDNDLSWSTLRKLGYRRGPPGTRIETVAEFRRFMWHRKNFGTMFVNPQVKVTGPNFSDEFFRIARREQLAWIGCLSDRLHSISRVKRFYSNTDAITRQLEFTGVLIVEGRHIFPDRWPEPIQLATANPIVGQRFGRLVVMELLPGNVCRCKCDCGRESVARKKHLLANRTKSCGCKRTELAAKFAKRKQNRTRS